jgi:heptaprenyl diphosphate synthase
MTRKATEQGDVVAILAALSLFLSTIDYIIPKPLPFLRLGIANLAFLVGLKVLKPRGLFALAAARVVIQGIIFGTLFSYASALSAAGSLASALVMIGVHRLFRDRISLVGVSVCGAFASNTAQITVACFFIFGPGVWLFAPPFLAVGTVASFLLGLIAERFSAQSGWVKKHRLVPAAPIPR